MEEEIQIRKLVEEGRPLYHWVRRKCKDGRKGFWRIVPYTYYFPAPRQAEIQLQVSRTASSTFGKKKRGELPPVAEEVRRRLKGYRTRPPTVSPKELERAIKLQRLATMLGVPLIKRRIPIEIKR